MSTNPQLELASLLDGREYLEEITPEERAQAKESGLVVVFGQSDDLMEFRGAIEDELGAWDGTTAYLTNSGLLTNKCDCGCCPYAKAERLNAATIEAIWHDNGSPDGYTWTFETDIHHETFTIMEDGEFYCRGIVFALADVKEKNL